MKKAISLVALLVVFVSMMQVSAFASQDTITDESAQTLNNLGIFKGTDQGYELDRDMTKVESLVMFIRLLGKEKEALETGSKTYRFTDVPSWAEQYVEYAYVNGLTNGISETEFGTQLIVDEKSYLTFMLRGLGYDDEKGDFSWAEAKEKALDLGIVKTWNNDNPKLTRGEVTEISLATLSTNIKDQEETLIYKLVKDKVVNSRVAVDAGIISEEQLTKINTLINVEPTNAADLPSSLLSAGIVNDATPIEAFLSANNGKTIIFPGGTYELDAPLDIVNLTDTVIDFKNTTFRFQNGFSGWSSIEKSAGGSYIGDSIIGFVGNKNVTVKNMSIDGNRDNMSMDQRSVGIWVVNCKNNDFIDAEIINVNYHGLVIYGGTKDVHFEGLHLKDNYGSWQCSDVYIANDTTDTCSFNNTFAERTFLETMDGCQVFYIHGYNSTITNLEIINCSIGVDYRLGTHYGENFVMDNVNGVVYVQSVNNTERANVVIKNVTATNIQAAINTRAAVAIWDADSAYFENINLTFSEETTTGNYGILLRRFGSADVVSNVKFKDVTIINSDYAAVYYLNMNETSEIENLVADPDNGYTLRADGTIAIQTVTNITTTNKTISDTNNVIIVIFVQ